MGSLGPTALGPSCLLDFVFHAIWVLEPTHADDHRHHVGHLVHLHAGNLVNLHVGHHVNLHVGHHVSHHVGHHNVVSMLCECSETLTEWKSESVTNGLTDGHTGVGARDACASKNTGPLPPFHFYHRITFCKGHHV